MLYKEVRGLDHLGLLPCDISLLFDGCIIGLKIIKFC